MDVRILPVPLNGAVDAIPSKSQAHRALICAALADMPTMIECDGESGDIAATAACLSALGAGIERAQGGYSVRPLRYVKDDSAVTLPCGQSGSTFRFLLPIVCALGREASFPLEGRLPERPISPLYEALVSHGCTLSPQGSTPFTAAGQLTPGKYVIDAGVSSQFISGLLFALPLLRGDSELRMTGHVESFPYIQLTLAMLENFEIKAKLRHMTFSVPGGQAYRSHGHLRVEGDWSNAAFWLAAGAVGEKSVTCKGLDMQSKQGDRAVLDILERFGAHIERNAAGATVSGGRLRGIEIDADDIPDLVPILAVVASAAQGTTVIRNAGRLRAKESDRLAAMTTVLRSLGAEADETEDGLIVVGGTPLVGGQISSFGDHRIAMAAAIAAGLCGQSVVIKGAEAVGKSYPGFFDDMRLLGGFVQPLNL